MDTRADFQRLLEDMDKAVQAKRQELSELDEHLERARSQLSEKEAQELRHPDGQGEMSQTNKQKLEEYFQELKRTYEQQLDVINEELSELETANVNLVRENQELKKELDALKESFEIVQVKSNVLLEDLEEVKSANLELNLRLATSEAEMLKNRKLLQRSHGEDEVLMKALEEKLDTLKREIAKRDEEIQQLRLNNNVALSDLGIEISGHSMSSDDAMSTLPLAEIANTIRNKNEQIEILKSKLAQATQDLEKNANLLESLNQYEDQGDVQSRSSPELLMQNQEELNQRVKMLDEELEAKDKQLNMLEFKTHYYERILPSILSDSVVDLSQALKQKSIDKTVEDKGLYLLESIKKLAEQLDDTKKLLDIIETVRDSNKAKDAKIKRLVESLNMMDESDEDRTNIDECFKKADTKESMETSTVELVRQNVKVEQNSGRDGDNETKRENELLELAMKEILLYIKQTDAQCGTIIIDCPSLERLCQMIEAKYVTESAKVQSEVSSGCMQTHYPINSHLFQLIILKSELDLLRGQNEQLRADAKLQRREYLKLIKDKLDLQANFDQEKTRRELEVQEATKKLNEDELDNQVTTVEHREKMKCETCANLAHLSNYLLQCIAKIESRVKANDELFIGRLTSLHRLNQLLERDLTFHEAILSRFRREYQTVVR